MDISDPEAPTALGHLPLKGEPTSVAMMGDTILVAIDRGQFQGELRLVDLQSRETVSVLSLQGQPDCLVISPDRRFAVVALENEAKEQFPEAPPGFVEIFTMEGEPSGWERRRVTLENLDMFEASDPEPEYLDINDDNLAAMVLQENNHIVLIDLEAAKVVGEFSAGEKALVGVDVRDDHRIELSERSAAVPREPDSVAWCSAGIITANEGDYRGGSRSFTIFDTLGSVLFDSGSQTEEIAVQLGHYPDHRSEARGTEPESVSVATYGDTEYIFIGLERANLVLVYSLKKGTSEPSFVQALATGPGPESVLPIPQRELLLIGSEADFPQDDLRSHIGLYHYQEGKPEFPCLRSDGLAWGALSGLTADPKDESILYSISDKGLRPNRIFRIEPSAPGPNLSLECQISDREGQPTEYDLEGIAASSDGGFWLVAEGGDNKADTLLRVGKDGQVLEELAVPPQDAEPTTKHRLAGVAEVAGKVYLVHQSGSDGLAPLTSYSPTDKSWQTTPYPLAAGHFLGGLSSGPDGLLAVLERDKLSHSEAAHKRIYTVDPKNIGSTTLQKTLVVDLIPEYRKHHFAVPAKVEGLAFTDGHYWVVNDNDAMKNTYGDTDLLKVHSQASAK